MRYVSTITLDLRKDAMTQDVNGKTNGLQVTRERAITIVNRLLADLLKVEDECVCGHLSGKHRGAYSPACDFMTCECEGYDPAD